MTTPVTRRRLIAATALTGGAVGATGLWWLTLRDRDPDPCEDLESPKPGARAPIAIERTYGDDEARLLASGSEVRYDETLGDPDEGPEWETATVAAWVTREATRLTIRRVDRLARERLGDLDGVSVGRDGGTARVEWTWWITRGGHVESRPAVGFEELVAAVPRMASVTLGLDGYTYPREIPVRVVCRPIHDT